MLDSGSIGRATSRIGLLSISRSPDRKDTLRLGLVGPLPKQSRGRPLSSGFDVSAQCQDDQVFVAVRVSMDDPPAKDLTSLASTLEPELIRLAGQRRVARRQARCGRTGGRMARRQARWGVGQRRRACRGMPRCLRRRDSPSVRTAFQLVDHFHCRLGVFGGDDRNRSHSTVTVIANAVRPDGHLIKAEVGALRKVALDGCLDFRRGPGRIFPAGQKQ